MTAKPDRLENTALRLKLCFILGIQPRSGTNYLFRVLRLHPHCIGPGPIWEDFVICYSDLLRKYATELFSKYNPKWAVNTNVGTEDWLLNLFGDALTRFLMLQVRPEIMEPPDSDGTAPQILLTKTPSVNGLGNFFDLFPDARLVIIVRDGRAVVESGVRSFNWDYETAMRKWAQAAKTIIDFQEKHTGKFLIVRFEDLFRDTKKEALRIFDFLGLDAGLYDFDGVQSLSVTGSSDIKKDTSKKMHWQPVKKSKGFNPIARFKSWDTRKHERFNWIAGQYMEKLGYPLENRNTDGNRYLLRYYILDMRWMFLNALRFVIKSAKMKYKKHKTG